MSHGGKGSAPRPFSVPHDDFAANFDRIFGKAPAEEIEEDEPEVGAEDDDEDDICSGCSGSGEGMHDGASCYKCHGSGVEPRERENDDC